MVDETLLEELLSQWQRDAARGQVLTSTELCRDRPELAPELERRIRAVRQRDDLAGQTATSIDPYATRPGPQSTAPSGSANPDDTASIPGYAIVSTLGRGGMGVVYKARQVNLNRTVALKMILSGAHAGPDELARFRTEAESLARLQHPNIVQVHEVGEREGKPFFSLEFCAGGALDRKLAGTPLPPPVAARMVETLARAMQAAHHANVIHRDLKPANILLTADGTPKITDFGLAKKLDEASQTQTGSVVGTPSYMAPEQAEGKRSVSPAVDIYALGAILYECLTGRPPFKAATAMDTVLQVIRAEPAAPRQLQPQLPRDLETICLKCLQKDPKNRYASAAELADDLHRYLAGEPILARPVGAIERSWRWCRRNPALAGSLMLMAASLIGGAGAASWFAVVAVGEKREADRARDFAQTEKGNAVKARDEAEASHRDSQRNLYVAEMNLAGQQAQSSGRGASFLNELLQRWRPARGEPDQRGWEWYYLRSLLQRPHFNLHRHRGEVLAVCWSPDGQRLASASVDQAVMLWDAQTGQHLKTLRSHTAAVRALAWNSERRILASADAAGVVKLWDAQTGQPLREFRRDADIFGVSINREGTLLASAGHDDGRVIVWDAGSGDIRFSFQGTAGLRCVGFSPDGTRLAAGGYDGKLHVWDLASRKRVTLTGRPNVWVTAVSWAPTGNRLACAYADDPPNPLVRIWDTDSGQMISALKGQAGGPRSVDWSPNGLYIATGDTEQTVRIWDPKTGRMRVVVQVESQAATIASVRWSPDGTRLAAGVTDRTVRVWDLDDLLAAASPFDDDLPSIDAVRWSPDGRQLALGGLDGVVRLWDATTRRQTATLNGNSGPVWSLAWNPDGRRLAVSGRQPEIRLWDIPTNGTIAAPTGDTHGVKSLAWSHDGRLLAGASYGNPGSDNLVHVWDADGLTELAPFVGHRSAIYVVDWSPDDRQLVSCTASKADSTVRIWDVEARRERSNINGWYHALRWTPKGGRLALPDCLRDTQSGRETAKLRGHTAAVQALSWSPGGERLASGAADQTVRIWDPDTGRQLVTLDGQNQAMGALDWSPDGRWLASADDGGKVHLWDALPGYLAERSPLALPELERKLRAAPPSAADLVLRAEVYARAGKWQEAAADWDQAQRIRGTNSSWFVAGWWVAGPFPAAFEATEETAADIDPVRPPVGDPVARESTPLHWRLADASSDGCLDLSGLPRRTETGCACVLVRVYSARSQVVTALLDSTGDTRLRINGELVREMKAATPPRNEDEAVPVTLKEGWNTLLFRVAVGEQQDQLRMGLTSPP
jgi:eukaryotic-like serine/threonine-protein kinase